ncbi:hypothetical protein QYM36_017494 [Artemia franciscana]|uniref:phospholipase D n=1 Tax=Artemia franciscana TaxID=6661 RepID=A0AA88HB49_ARTSF|nr:hypothetical protein QYM36_017494 [Artemia franciscana]
MLLIELYFWIVIKLKEIEDLKPEDLLEFKRSRYNISYCCWAVYIGPISGQAADRPEVLHIKNNAANNGDIITFNHVLVHMQGPDDPDRSRSIWFKPGFPICLGILEKEIAVTEQIYFHSKILIVDDKTVICDSANINERSLIGNKDSEIAVIFEDESDKTRFAASLRKAPFKEHLGLASKDLDDPTCDALYKKCREVAEANTKMYQQVSYHFDLGGCMFG